MENSVQLSNNREVAALHTAHQPKELVVVNSATGKRQPVKLSDLGVRQVIDAGTVVSGDFKCRSSMLVRGSVNGNIEVDAENGMIIVHPEGTVNGDVKANFVYIAGSVTGKVSCNGLRISKTGIFCGEFTCNEIRIDSGAKLELRESKCASANQVEG